MGDTIAIDEGAGGKVDVFTAGFGDGEPLVVADGGGVENGAAHLGGRLVGCEVKV